MGHLDHVESNNSKPKQNMSNITIKFENVPTIEEHMAIAALRVAGDNGNLTRNEAASVLRDVVKAAYVRIGGGHIALCRGWHRVALVTSTHPDWN